MLGIDRWHWAQIGFALLLLLSLALLAAVVAGGYATDPSGPHLPQPERETEEVLLTAASVLTAITSSLGLIVTAILGWRKDRREVETMAGDLQRQELEIAKLKHELARLEGAAPLQAPER